MARVRHTITGIVADVPTHIVEHPVLGQYYELAEDSFANPDCKPCIEAEAAAKDFVLTEPLILDDEPYFVDDEPALDVDEPADFDAKIDTDIEDVNDNG